MNDENKIELLKTYSEFYKSNIDQMSQDYSTMWTLLIVYLTGILTVSGYIFFKGDILLLILLPIIHIGWFWGTINKTLWIIYHEENAKYLETIINKIIEKIKGYSNYKIIKFTDLFLKLQGDYKHPFKHPFTTITIMFYSLPGIILAFIFYVTFYLSYKYENKYLLVIIITTIIYIIIITIVMILYVLARNRMYDKSKEFIKNIINLETKDKK